MSKSIILCLGRGELATGCPDVSIELLDSDNQSLMKKICQLPSELELLELSRRWQVCYQDYYEFRGWYSRGTSLEDDEDPDEISQAGITNVSSRSGEELLLLSEELINRFNGWLKTQQFNEIEMQLRSRLALHEKIRLVVETESEQLRKLPWARWKFIEDYRQAGLAVSNLNRLRLDKLTITQPREKVRILCIIGNSEDIDTGADRKQLKRLRGATLTFLDQPSAEELNDRLWERGWDILFFAGHSSSRVKGCIKVNQNESLTIEELKYALSKAIENNLKLVIFNSCDGLKLARDLADLNIPAALVMRESVPDAVAQKFLKYFLQAFCRGDSLDVSVRKATERLQGIEKEFPCASWLPILVWNRAEELPRWQNWCIQKPGFSEKPRCSGGFFVASIVTVTLLVMGLRLSGMLQGWELWAFDRMMQLRPSEVDRGRERRLLVVEVTKEDVERLGGEYPLRDRTILRLLKTLDKHKPRLIGLDIYLDKAVRGNQAELVQYLQQKNNVIPPCVHPDLKYSGVSPPTGISKNQVGFVDVVEDPDGIVRRHLLAVDPPDKSPCPALYALSSQLALRYLAAKGYSLRFPATDYWEINRVGADSVGLGVLKAPTGFYQQAKATRGHQILLNYRSYNSLEDIAERVTLTQVLSNQVNPNLISDKIILIGVTDPTLAKDEFNTPYNQEIRGVLLHAQMLSQLLSAVEDKRPLLRFWPLWGDALYVWACSLVGAILVWRFQSVLRLVLAGGVVLIVLWGSCFILLLTRNVLLPFVPSALALVTPGAALVIYSVCKNQRQG